MPKLGPGTGGGGEGNGPRAVVVPPNDYVIALRWFQRKRAKESGKDYLSGRWEICGGPNEGKQFFANLSLDLSKKGTVTRWQILIEALGIEETFELGDSDEGTAREGDRNIARLFKNKPFAAEVDKTRDGQYDNNGLKQIHFLRKYTPEWLAICDVWRDKLAEEGDPEDYAGDPPDSEPDNMGMGEEDFGPTDYDAAPTRERVDDPFPDGLPDPEDDGPAFPAPPPARAPARAPAQRPAASRAKPPPPPPPAEDEDWNDKF